MVTLGRRIGFVYSPENIEVLLTQKINDIVKLENHIHETKVSHHEPSNVSLKPIHYVGLGNQCTIMYGHDKCLWQSETLQWMDFN